MGLRLTWVDWGVTRRFPGLLKIDSVGSAASAVLMMAGEPRARLAMVWRERLA